MGARILIVDDEVTLTFFLKRCLGAARPGDVIDSVNTAADAIRRLDSANYDLVIVDQYLPEARGVRILQRARMQTPPARAILMTDYPSAAVERAARDAGATGYLLKPFDLHTARELVEQCLAPTQTYGGVP
jgi:DNA-binding NarL/FixJ family response regulator